MYLLSTDSTDFQLRSYLIVLVFIDIKPLVFVMKSIGYYEASEMSYFLYVVDVFGLRLLETVLYLLVFQVPEVYLVAIYCDPFIQQA